MATPDGLEEALVELSDMHRAALRLALIEKVQCREIGRRLGISSGEAIRLLSEAMGHLSGWRAPNEEANPRSTPAAGVR